jgi:hypothetical protein
MTYDTSDPNDHCPVCQDHPGQGHPCEWVLPLEEGEVYTCGRESPMGSIYCGGAAHDPVCDVGRGTEKSCHRQAVATVLAPLYELGRGVRAHRVCEEHSARWAHRRFMAYPQCRAFPDHWLVWDKTPRQLEATPTAYAVSAVNPKDSAWDMIIKSTYSDALLTSKMCAFPTKIEALYKSGDVSGC